MRAVGRFAIITFSVIAALIASFFILFFISSRPPKEDKIISNFKAHRASFERVRTMLLEDKSVQGVAPWGIEPEEAWVHSHGALSRGVLAIVRICKLDRDSVGDQFRRFCLKSLYQSRFVDLRSSCFHPSSLRFKMSFPSGPVYPSLQIRSNGACSLPGAISHIRRPAEVSALTGAVSLQVVVNWSRQIPVNLQA